MIDSKKQIFLHNNINLGFWDVGDGDPILLIHGFASNAKINWIDTGWFKLLLNAGYRVIAIDNRGHGDSTKIYDRQAYTPEAMAADALALLEHLKIKKAHIMGYSMGARISAYFSILFPTYVASIIFGGLGMGMVTGSGSWQEIAEALLAPDINSIDDARGLMFRQFADNTKSDKRALAACVVSSKKELTIEELQHIIQPALVVVGEYDEISGSAQGLADLLPRGHAVTLAGRNHMLAVGDKHYKASVLNFLAENKL